MRSGDLTAIAIKLIARNRKGQPRQSDIKRAQNTARYATLLALCGHWEKSLPCFQSIGGRTAASSRNPLLTN